MKTSYIANAKNVTSPVLITLWRPRYMDNLPHYPKLAPTKEILTAYKEHLINDEEYVILFQNDILDKLNPKIIYDELVEKFTEDATLLCYETPAEFCHRRLVAKWFESTLGIQVPEYIR